MPCTDLMVGDQAGELELLVNGQKGEIRVPLNTDVRLRLQRADPNDDILIVNISATPDVELCQGNSDFSGVFECTVQFQENTSVELRGYEDCFAGLCAKQSNTVRVIAGESEEKKGTDWATIGLLAAGLLGAAYVLGNRR